MFAAAEGRSNIGIPKSVGKEFAAADRGGDLPERVKSQAGGSGLGTTTMRDTPAFASAYGDLLSRAEGLASRPYPGPYPGPVMAGFTPMQLQGFRNIEDIVGRRPGMQAGGDTLTEAWAPPLVGSNVDWAREDPDFKRKFQIWWNSLPANIRAGVSIESAYRTAEQQAKIRAEHEAMQGGVAAHPAARPWESPHQYGVAADLTGPMAEQAAATLATPEAQQKYGLAFPVHNDPLHIEPLGWHVPGTTEVAGPAATAAGPSGTAESYLHPLPSGVTPTKWSDIPGMSQSTAAGMAAAPPSAFHAEDAAQQARWNQASTPQGYEDLVRGIAGGLIQGPAQTAPSGATASAIPRPQHKPNPPLLATASDPTGKGISPFGPGQGFDGPTPGLPGGPSGPAKPPGDATSDSEPTSVDTSQVQTQRGGAIGLGARPRYQGGGGLGMSLSMAEPTWTRQEIRQDAIMDQPHNGGLIAGSGAGRTDQLPLAVPPESHVIPAMEMAILGQGNGIHGSRIIEAGTQMGPWGTAIHQPGRHLGQGAGHPTPHLLPIGEFEEMQRLLSPQEPSYFGGSGTSRLASEGGSEHRTSILAASGEFVIPREDWTTRDEHGQVWRHAGVRTIGGGDIALGHKKLNDMILRIRQHGINFMRRAPKPKT